MKKSVRPLQKYTYAVLIGLIVFIVLASLSSCRTSEQIRQSKCEKAAYKWGCDWGHDTAYIRETVTNTIYRDTTIKIYIPGETKTDTIYVDVSWMQDGTVKITSKKSVLNTSLAYSEAQIVNGVLKHTIVQKDSVYNYLVKNAIKIYDSMTRDKTVSVIIKKVEKELTWWQKFRMHTGDVAWFLIALSLLIFGIKKGLHWYM